MLLASRRPIGLKVLKVLKVVPEKVHRGARGQGELMSF